MLQTPSAPSPRRELRATCPPPLCAFNFIKAKPGRQSRAYTNWGMANPQSWASPEQSRTCKNWGMGNPGLVPSNPRPAKIGVWPILGQSRAILDLQKVGYGQSRASPKQSRTCKKYQKVGYGQSRASPEQSRACKNWGGQSQAIPDLQKLG